MSTLRINTSADDAGFKQLLAAINRYGASIDKMRKSTDQVTQAVDRLTKVTKMSSRMTAFMTVGLDRAITAVNSFARAIVGTLVGAIRTAINESLEFNRALAEVSTLLPGRATAAINRIRDAALEMAGRFGQLPVQVTKAFYDAVSAGATTAAASMNVLNAAGALSVGGLADIQEATNGLVATMRAFGLSGNDFEQARDVAETFFAAMVKGRTTIPALVNNMGKVSGVAKAAGLSLEETFAAVAAITVEAPNTEIAVVGLANALKATIKPSIQAKRAAKAYGVELNIKGRGDFIRFLKQMKELQKENAEAFNAILPDIRGFKAALSLLSRDGESYLETLDAMRNKNLFYQQAVEKVRETMSFQIQQFKSLGRVLAITLGDFITKSPTFLGAMKGINTAIGFVTKQIGGLNNALNISSKAAEEFTIKALAGMLNGMGDLIISIGRIISALAKYGDALLWVYKYSNLVVEGMLAMAGPMAQSLYASIKLAISGFRSLIGALPESDNMLGRTGQTFVKVGGAIKRASQELRGFQLTQQNAPPVDFSFPDMPQTPGLSQREAPPLKKGSYEPGVKKREESSPMTRGLRRQMGPVIGQLREAEKLWKNQQRLIEQNATAAQKFTDPMLQGLGDLILEGKKLGDVVTGIGKQFVRMAIQWISKQAAIRIANSITTTSYVANKSAEAAAEKSAGTTKIMVKAASAAAGAAESQASIPFVGPILAIAAAVAMLAFVIGMASGFNKGGVVPGGGPNVDSTLAAVTPGERILSRDQTEAFDSLLNAASGNGLAKGMGGPVFNFNLPAGGRIDYDDVARLEDFIEKKFAPTWFRLEREQRIGSASLATKRV